MQSREELGLVSMELQKYWFRPRVHRRQIVERQFCRHDVFNRFEWTCRVVACVALVNDLRVQDYIH
jgi:hypothetical protein